MRHRPAVRLMMALGLAFILAFADAAPAEESKPGTAFSGNLSLVSQYVFRGLSQTNGDPALQGGMDFSFADGLYAGMWLSNISWYTDQNANIKSAPVSLASPGSVGGPYAPNRSNAASLEWDFYAGLRNSFGGGAWSYDIGVIEYFYPGRYENVGAYRKPHTTEIYGSIGYRGVSLKYSRGISPCAFGVNESKGADYLDLSANVSLGRSGFKAQAHIGGCNFPGTANIAYWGASGGDNDFFDYTDYRLGLTKDAWGCTFGLLWTRANTKDAAPDGETTAYLNAFGRNIGGDRVALSVARTF